MTDEWLAHQVEMVERVALAADGGSHANKYAKQHKVREIVRAIEAMTIADVESILFDKRFDEARAEGDRRELAAAIRADLIAAGRAT